MVSLPFKDQFSGFSFGRPHMSLSSKHSERDGASNPPPSPLSAVSTVASRHHQPAGDDDPVGRRHGRGDEANDTPQCRDVGVYRSFLTLRLGPRGICGSTFLTNFLAIFLLKNRCFIQCSTVKASPFCSGQLFREGVLSLRSLRNHPS